MRFPEGWIVDGEGRPTTDPHQFGKGGVLLPLGGPEGHKGYSLAVMVEILSALLPGLGFGVSPTGRHNDGCFLACFNVEAFRPLETFKQEVAEFADYLKDTKPAVGFEEVCFIPAKSSCATKPTVAPTACRLTTPPGANSKRLAKSTALATRFTFNARRTQDQQHHWAARVMPRTQTESALSELMIRN